MKRLHQLLLIATFAPLCWLMMQVVHELGHIAAALGTGGTVTKVVLHPLTISRTDSSGSVHPLLVVWAGPVIGVIVPLTLLVVCKAAKLKWNYLVQFFAGTCLIANGAYIGVGSLQSIGDAGDLLRQGCPIGVLWFFGLGTVPFGLYLWNGLGASFGLGQAAGKVDRIATYLSAVLLFLVVVIEATFSSSQ
jgi:Peptidase M50B-like